MPPARFARVPGIPCTCTTVRRKSDGLSQENRSPNDHPLRLVRSAMKPLSQCDQTFGELVPHIGSHQFRPVSGATGGKSPCVIAWLQDNDSLKSDREELAASTSFAAQQ